jgi:hypothetical protein
MPPEVQSLSAWQSRVVRVSTPSTGTQPFAVVSHAGPISRTSTTRKQHGFPPQSCGPSHAPDPDEEQETDVTRTAVRTRSLRDAIDS